MCVTCTVALASSYTFGSSYLQYTACFTFGHRKNVSKETETNVLQRTL